MEKLNEWIEVNRKLDELTEYRRERTPSLDDLLKFGDLPKEAFKGWFEGEAARRKARMEFSLMNFLETKRALSEGFHPLLLGAEISQIDLDDKIFRSIFAKAKLFTLPLERVIAAQRAAAKLGHSSYEWMADEGKALLEKSQRDEAECMEDAFLLRDVMIAQLDENQAVPFPTDLPFPSCFFSFAPSVSIKSSASLAWGGLFDLFGEEDLVTFSGVLLADTGHAWFVVHGWYRTQPGPLGRSPDQTILVQAKAPGMPWHLPFLQSAWLCWQLVDMVRQCREVVFSKKRPGRNLMRTAWKRATKGLSRNLRASWRPPAYYEVPLAEHMSEPEVRRLSSSACPKTRMKDYHTDRRAHERVLVRRIKKWQSAEAIQGFKDHWLKKGYSIFESPCEEVEAYYRFDTRKCGLQPDDEIWAIEVVWVEETKIGNLDAPYVPGNRSVWGDVIR